MNTFLSSISKRIHALQPRHTLQSALHKRHFSNELTPNPSIVSQMSFDAMKGWFVEVNNQWRGTALAIEVEEILHDAKSDYQVRLFLRMLH